MIGSMPGTPVFPLHARFLRAAGPASMNNRNHHQVPRQAAARKGGRKRLKFHFLPTPHARSSMAYMLAQQGEISEALQIVRDMSDQEGVSGMAEAATAKKEMFQVWLPSIPAPRMRTSCAYRPVFDVSKLVLPPRRALRKEPESLPLRLSKQHSSAAFANLHAHNAFRSSSLDAADKDGSQMPCMCLMNGRRRSF